MANTTNEFWEINGVSLHQYGWNVSTVGGGRYGVPPRRGDNIKLAYVPGQVPRSKLPDSRPVNLNMWVTGTDPATGVPPADQILRWNDSWDFLRRLVWTIDGRTFTLTRRWRLTVAGSPTVVVADAQAELVGAMEPTMTGRTRADFVMELLLPDPYFYGTQVTQALTLDTPVSLANPGSDVAAFGGLELDLVGPLTNPRLTNASLNPHVWVQLNAVIASGQTVRLSVGGFTATRLSDSANLIGDVVHSGARYWMGLTNNANLLTLTAGSGTGSGVLRFRPPYV